MQQKITKNIYFFQTFTTSVFNIMMSSFSLTKNMVYDKIKWNIICKSTSK